MKSHRQGKTGSHYKWKGSKYSDPRYRDSPKNRYGKRAVRRTESAQSPDEKQTGPDYSAQSPDRQNPTARFGQSRKNFQSPQTSAKFGQARPNFSSHLSLKQIAKKAMQKYGFETSFPPSVMDAVDSLDPSTPKKANSIKDLTSLIWSSIDNIDTEDLDQIEYCEKAPNNEILVRVGVADVDAYVPKGSILDVHARKNTTSIYTGVEIFPMLPDRLSKNLSSLAPNQVRLAMVIEFYVLPSGIVRPGKIYPALVKNKAKLVYEQVGAWLEGKGSIPKTIETTPNLEAQMRLQDEASSRLGSYRFSQGALELQTLETRAIVKNEKVLGLYVIEDNRAKRIIENLMIGANGTMSKYLESSNVPTIQRVVRMPKYWKEIVELAKSRGYQLPSSPNALSLSQFLTQERSKAPNLFSDLSLTVVKLLGPGEYVMYDKANPIGHFCLAVRSYTHGTAPNRRYVDLIIQRILKSTLFGKKPSYSRKELSSLSEWCTGREMASKKVERFVTKAEAATLLFGKIGFSFDAIITGASSKGIYARLIEPPVEGKIIHRCKVHIGQKVRVKLVNLNPEEGWVDLEME